MAPTTTSNTITESACSLRPLGFDVRVLTAGAGPVVLFLHGNPDCADEWRGVIQRLGDRYRCIAPDFPGYGKSPRPPESFRYDIPAQMAFVDAVLEAVAASGPVIVVVHDVGGFVGTPWAHANLARVGGFVFTNTVAFEGFEWFYPVTRWGDGSAVGKVLARLSMHAIGLREGALFRKLFTRQSPQLSAAEIDRFARQFATNANAKDATIRQFRHAIRPNFFAGFDAMNRRISEAVACRVVWGEGDVYLSDEYARRFGSAQVRMLPGVGHWVPIVAPGEVADAVRAVHESQGSARGTRSRGASA